ncbi:MAG: hypothetical protein ACFCUG_00835 [Thiotrichales bacterium]
MNLGRGTRAGLLVTVLAVGVALHAEPDFPDEVDTSHVNSGDLTFLEHPPANAVHHHHNAIRITPSSLTDGWVRMDQCHEHLDAVPRAQIVYREGRVRDLRITRDAGIEAAWVEGATVQLRAVGKPAVLCVSADTQALQDNQDGTYTLASGPFMRQFLDGYYPMRVSMSIEFPEELRFLDTSPNRQRGFEVSEEPRRIRLNTWFEGRLRTEIRFDRPRRG